MIEKYYPNYYRSEDIAILNDLQKIIDGEWEEGDSAHKLLSDYWNKYGEGMELMYHEDYDKLYLKVLEETIMSMNRIIKNGSK